MTNPTTQDLRTTTMTDLSLAAQAAWEAAWNDCPVQCGDIEGTRRSQIAAALEALADQVVPEHAEPVGDEHDGTRADQWQRIRLKILAIAAELEGAE